MRTTVRAAIKQLKMRKVNTKETDLSPVKYDLKAINIRAHKAMTRTGRTRLEIAEFFGMDCAIPLAMQPPEKIPRPTMANIIKLAQFLGVSARWMLYGEPENDVDFFVTCPGSGAGPQVTATSTNAAKQGAAVISGASNSTVIVQNISGLNEIENEVISTLRRFTLREQATVLAYIYALEDELKEKEKGPQH